MSSLRVRVYPRVRYRLGRKFPYLTHSLLMSYTAESDLLLRNDLLKVAWNARAWRICVCVCVCERELMTWLDSIGCGLGRTSVKSVTWGSSSTQTGLAEGTFPRQPTDTLSTLRLKAGSHRRDKTELKQFGTRSELRTVGWVQSKRCEWAFIREPTDTAY